MCIYIKITYITNNGSICHEAFNQVYIYMCIYINVYIYIYTFIHKCIYT